MYTHNVILCLCDCILSHRMYLKHRAVEILEKVQKCVRRTGVSNRVVSSHRIEHETAAQYRSGNVVSEKHYYQYSTVYTNPARSGPYTISHVFTGDEERARRAKNIKIHSIIRGRPTFQKWISRYVDSECTINTYLITTKHAPKKANTVYFEILFRKFSRDTITACQTEIRQMR